MIDVALLGTGGMMPLPHRYLTSLICRIDGSLLLIDCGEGTQITLKLLGWGYKNIDVICFTHFHADHISGLPGMLLAIGNSCRTEPLLIIGPRGIRNVVERLRVIAPVLPFEITFEELPVNAGEFKANNGEPFTNGEYLLSALPLDHGMPCLAYKIELKRAGKFDLERAEKLDLPKIYWKHLQRGEDVEYDGRRFTPDMVLGGARRGLKLCYCTDTRPTWELPEFINGADLFVCEGIYGDDEKLDKVTEHKHMLFSEAAAIARDGGVDELWLTHFSPAMPDPENYIDIARAVFPNTKLGRDRKTKTLIFKDE